MAEYICPNCYRQAQLIPVGDTGSEDITCGCGFTVEHFADGTVKRIFIPGGRFKPEKIENFDGQYRFLSNFATLPGKILYDGKEYPTSEHLFHALKTQDSLWREKIRTAPDPGKGTTENPGAKALGRQVPLRENWEEVKIDVMRLCLKLKFAIPHLKEKLLATGEAILVEGNTWNDTFWGVCHGVGENMLGCLLMELRAQLAQGKEPWPGLLRCVACAHARRATTKGFVGCFHWIEAIFLELSVNPKMDKKKAMESALPEQVLKVGGLGQVFVKEMPEENIEATADSGLLIVPEKFRCSFYRARRVFPI